jgi:DNA-binding LacI/PurR family transcriptional regulator
MIGGPANDRRCSERRDGFASEFASAEVVYAKGWYFEDGLPLAKRVLRKQPDGLFCANDRLAEAFLHVAQANALPIPLLIGFDDAPIAEKLNFSSIGFPREEIATAAALLIKRRMQGDDSLAFRQVFTPRPVIRRGPSLEGCC